MSNKLIRKSIVFVTLLALFSLLFISCSSSAESLTSVVSKDPKFDSAVLTLTANDFANAGYAFGDSLDISFGNGYTLNDVPYYNGYYVKTGEPVVVAYPSNEYVLITYNNRGIWSQAGLSDDCTVELKLNTAGKYTATYEALSQSYSLDRSTYESDEIFANFRALSGGSMKDNFIYRGASPVDNSRNRASYADKLLESVGIVCVIDLADSESDMQGYIASDDFDSPYTKSLYEEGHDILLSMGSNYDSDNYKTCFAAGLRHMLECGGPVYIHCMEGKDRTGFVCLVLEALAGADYNEMCSDYMTTYANYYGITEDKAYDKYSAVVSLYFDSFMEYLSGISSDDVEALKSHSYRDDAVKYLKGCGLTDEEISGITSFISK